MENRTFDDDGGVELPASLGAGKDGPSDLSEREADFAPTTVVELSYFHPDEDERVHFARTVRVDRLHVIINAIEEAEA